MDDRFISIAAQEAEKVNGDLKHGAVLVCNHKLMAVGHNTAERNIFSGCLTGGCHAEHSVLHQYYQTQRKVAEEQA